MWSSELGPVGEDVAWLWVPSLCLLLALRARGFAVASRKIGACQGKQVFLDGLSIQDGENESLGKEQ